MIHVRNVSPTRYLTFPLPIILITFFFFLIVCEFYENLNFSFPDGVSPLSFNLGVSHS